MREKFITQPHLDAIPIAADLTRVGRNIGEAERDRRKRQQRAA